MGSAFVFNESSCGEGLTAERREREGTGMGNCDRMTGLGVDGDGELFGAIAEVGSSGGVEAFQGVRRKPEGVGGNFDALAMGQQGHPAMRPAP